MHEIALTESCPLIFPEGQDTFMVNSWHHQGLKNIPNGINVVARSFDSLPEAIYIDQEIHPFMIAVQFHLKDLAVIILFIKECETISIKQFRSKKRARRNTDLPMEQVKKQL